MRHEPEDNSRFGEGCLLSLGGLILTIGIIGLLAGGNPGNLPRLLFSGRAPIGYTQFLYVAPALFFLWRFRRAKAAMGMLTSAALVLLLSMACGRIIPLGR